MHHKHMKKYKIKIYLRWDYSPIALQSLPSSKGMSTIIYGFSTRSQIKEEPARRAATARWPFPRSPRLQARAAPSEQDVNKAANTFRSWKLQSGPTRAA
jgi:hypothetical protein